MGGIFSLEARDMDTKLLSAPESNNTLARCWFRRNIPVTMFGFDEHSYPLASRLFPGHCCWWSFGTDLHNAFSLHMYGNLPILVADCFHWLSAFLTQGMVSTVVGVGVTVVVVIIVAVVVVVESSSVIKLSFVIT
ncbi:hypothetical protein Tco_0875726 [Tanacetum coccineum]|uniref:Uncharacterized protein n=1 Tax=Tanacetum coccineum TaxID=301880 RepID=A0ABQ5BQ85_9ASTR